jgi:hypothetical protein
LGCFSEILDDVRARIRGLRPRNTIAIPIVLLLLFIGAGILTAGYYVNKSVFHAVFEERESNKARNIHLTIESIVSTEVNRISSLAKILKNDTDIVYGLFHYSETQGGTRPLKSAMSQIYPKMNLRVFVMSDTNGNVLYRAGKEKVPGEGNLERMPVGVRGRRQGATWGSERGPGLPPEADHADESLPESTGALLRAGDGDPGVTSPGGGGFPPRRRSRAYG